MADHRDAAFRGLDLNLLLTLDVLLDIRSVTGTAERVGVTQSAVSHRLARLRDFFGDPLLVAAGDDFVLTPRAEALRDPLRLVLTELRNVVVAPSEIDPERVEQSFVLAVADLAEVSLLPPLLEHLARVAPRVSVRTRGRSMATGQALAERKIDFAVAPGEGSIPGVSLDQTRGVRQRRLVTDGFSVLARRDHPRLRGRLTRKRYLAESHVLVAPQGGPGGIADVVLARQGEHRHIAAQVASFLSAPFLVQTTDYLLTCPTSLAEAMARPLGLRVFKPPIDLPPTKLFLFWHERMHHDPGHRWFREELLGLTGKRD